MNTKVIRSNYTNYNYNYTNCVSMSFHEHEIYILF